jgi:hypothetical protein
MPIVAEIVEYVVRIDTHARTHTYCVVHNRTGAIVHRTSPGIAVRARPGLGQRSPRRSQRSLRHPVSPIPARAG